MSSPNSIAVGSAADFAPIQLEASEYEAISRSMLGFSGDTRPLASVSLIDTAISAGHIIGKNYSLAAQLDQLQNHPSLADPALTVAPEAYLFTINSAVPVADCFRVYYNELGAPTPTLGTIHANQLSLNSPAADKIRQAEIERLAPILGDLRHVCIVDQYINSGNTVNFAAQIARGIGVPLVSAICGRWYECASEGDVDVAKVTSSHAAFMREVGVKLARNQTHF